MTRYNNSTTGLGKAIQYIVDSTKYGKQCSGENQGEISGRHDQNSKQNRSNGNNSTMSEDAEAKNNNNDNDSAKHDQDM